MAASKNPLAGWQKLAEAGDPDAQIIVAWEYAKGKLVAKDLSRAVALFRAAEPAKGRLARFNLAKVLMMNRDQSFEEVIRQDCNAGFGPALYLMGVAEFKGIFHDRNIERAVEYFSAAAQDNHVTSEFFAWRLQKKSILRWLVTLPYGIGLSFRGFAICLRDPDDLRM